MKKQLALYGGEKVKQQPYGTGRRFGKKNLPSSKKHWIRTHCSTGREPKSRHYVPSSPKCTERNTAWQHRRVPQPSM